MSRGIGALSAALVLGGCATVTRGTADLGAERRDRDGVDGAKLHHALRDFGGTKSTVRFEKAGFVPQSA